MKMARNLPRPAPGGRRLVRKNSYAIEPPIEPMLAKLADVLPAAAEYLFEPKWDGFRALIFR
jgi:ATP-dependent DNA ligase